MQMLIAAELVFLLQFMQDVVRVERTGIIVGQKYDILTRAELSIQLVGSCCKRRKPGIADVIGSRRFSIRLLR